MNSQTKERFGLAALLGIPISIMSAFVKWGGEFPLPSRNPKICFTPLAVRKVLLGRRIKPNCSCNFLNPPCVFLRDYLGITDQYAGI